MGLLVKSTKLVLNVESSIVEEQCSIAASDIAVALVVSTNYRFQAETVKQNSYWKHAVLWSLLP